MAEPSHCCTRVQRTSRALGRGTMWAGAEQVRVTEPGRSLWSTQKDNGIPEAYSRKQKMLFEEEKKLTINKNINPSIAKYEKQHNQGMRGRGRQGTKTMFVSETPAFKLQYRWCPCFLSCTPQKHLPVKPKGLLWACRVKANSIFTAAGKVKLKHEQGSIHRCLGEEPTAAHSSCSSASCSPGAFVKTRSKGCVQAGPLIFWSPQREARPSSLSCWASWGKLDKGPRVGNQPWATSTDVTAEFSYLLKNKTATLKQATC